MCIRDRLFPYLTISSANNQTNDEQIHSTIQELEKEIAKQEESVDELVKSINTEYNEKKSSFDQSDNNNDSPSSPSEQRRKSKQEMKKASIPNYSGQIKKQERDKFDQELDMLARKQEQNEDIFDDLEKLTENLDKEFEDQMDQINKNLKQSKDLNDQFSLFQEMAANNPFQKILNFFSQMLEDDMNNNLSLIHI
eukprot:TRINITY_DN8478_c0_g1_i1.p2 TRINITY_DN8478_c0_g1~~TRINITY_DN8478_c0_g1_i1.p2  ORF type:complete len:195 (+),score=66.12 TRINITY_DN8478_c0_g1_i1:94-678(+)